MIRRPPRSTRKESSAASDVYKRQATDSEWQWHQLGHMQVCTSLQTDHHASTPPLSFLQAGCPSLCLTNSVKALKALCCCTWQINFSLHLFYKRTFGNRRHRSVPDVSSVTRALKEYIASCPGLCLVVVFAVVVCCQQSILQCFDTVGWAAGRASGL